MHQRTRSGAVRATVITGSVVARNPADRAPHNADAARRHAPYEGADRTGDRS